MKLVAIGFLSEMRVYVNLSKEEAMKRYNEENPEYTIEDNNLDVKEINVEDSFWVYDIWGNEETKNG
jgi:hypothetical protein